MRKALVKYSLTVFLSGVWRIKKWVDKVLQLIAPCWSPLGFVAEATESRGGVPVPLHYVSHMAGRPCSVAPPRWAERVAAAAVSTGCGE